ncbi:TNF receptor-associated factor 3-like [Asterias amurensis]|uniref:TNF receptor-associated factor 3-like n=1 Tax=Asterias amurensis TaxID=7602 RepID=UPI003AB71FFB
MATSTSSLEPLRSKTASIPGNVSFSPMPNVSPPPSLIEVEGIPKVLFINPVDEQFVCTICKKVLRWAMQEGCGCRACYGCLHRTIKTQSETVTCPHCGETFPKEDIIKDNHARKKLEKLNVYCANREAGCQKQLLLRNLDEHVQQECEYEMIQCIHRSKGCTAGILRHKFAQHLEDECLFRRVKCQFCGTELMANEQESHEKKCRELMVSCPNKCGTTMVHKDKIDEHITTSCPLTAVECLFKRYGCNFSQQRKMMDDHMQEAQAYHLTLVTQHIIQMDSMLSAMSRKVDAITVGNQMHSLDISSGGFKQLPQRNEKQIRDLQRNIAPRLEKIDMLEDRMNQMAKQTTVMALQESLKPVQNKYEQFQSKLQELEQQVAGRSSSGPEVSLMSGSAVSASRITAMENQMGMHAVRIAEHDLRFQVMETANFEGTLLWKIKDFSRRKRDADNGKTLSLYSQPFYTSRYGYKMCARVYLNGDGMGKGTHVSLFFVVMRGDYDALLPWPFSPKVTLILMDQDKGRRHLTDSFRPDPSSSSFQRPTNEMNIASGCPLFVSQSVLSDVAYVKDNVMFIKVIVDVTDVVRP